MTTRAQISAMDSRYLNFCYRLLLIGVQTTAPGVKTTAPWSQNYYPLESKVLPPGVIFWGPEMLHEAARNVLTKIKVIGQYSVYKCIYLQISTN